jgi:phosphatidylserine/phosphatidylglycerophosphate/cardiolipin synthase-like enzyme
VSERAPGGERPSTGRVSEPVDATAGQLRPPRFLEELTIKAGHLVGRSIDSTIAGRHRLTLRRAGWEHALDVDTPQFARGTWPPREGNRVEVLVDGSEALPRMAADMAAATSHVHLTGWYLSPELQLSREEEPLVVRTLLAELAERIDVRVLLWKGAPVPLFRPSRSDVREVEQKLTRHTQIRCALDACTGASHCHHEKTIVIDGRIAYVGGIDLTIDGGDPFDTPAHRARGGIGWHDAAVRIEGPAVGDVAEHFRLRWQAATRERLPEPQPAPAAAPGAAADGESDRPRGDVTLQIVRTLPAGAYRAASRGDYSILESYLGALRSAERLVYLENQFLWSPEVVDVLVQKLLDPPIDDFRVVVLLPARANDGADISRGQVAALIDADAGDDRFLACTIYAREEKLRDIVYVHAKIGIVDDRWLTVGSANLNAHSLMHDTEMNVVTHDEGLARSTRLRLWSEHLERDEKTVSADPASVVDRLWRPIATQQLHRIERGEPLTHRLVRLPGVSRRRRRVFGSLQSHLYDV